jgi:hypothetical protein
MKTGIIKGFLAITFFLILASHWIKKGEEATQGASKQGGSNSMEDFCKPGSLIIGCDPNSKK